MKNANYKTHRGVTAVELLLGVTLLLIIGMFALSNLTGHRNRNELEVTVKQIATLLREAQSRSQSQVSGKSWGVHFDNAASGAFYALFISPYTSSSEEIHVRLPPRLRFASSSVSPGSSLDITFAAITGIPSTSTSIALELTGGGTVVSTTITVSARGVINY